MRTGRESPSDVQNLGKSVFGNPPLRVTAVMAAGRAGRERRESSRRPGGGVGSASARRRSAGRARRVLPHRGGSVRRRRVRPIGTVAGVVEDLGVRITRLRDDQGKLWIISNATSSKWRSLARAVERTSRSESRRARMSTRRVAHRMRWARPYTRRSRATSRSAQCPGVVNWDAAKTVIRVHIVCGPRSLAPKQIRVRELIYENSRSRKSPSRDRCFARPSPRRQRYGSRRH